MADRHAASHRACRKQGPFPLAEGVAPDTNFIGLMLPYTPLHHILLGDFAEAVANAVRMRSRHWS